MRATSPMYCTACGQDSVELLRMIAELRRRIRLARRQLQRAIDASDDEREWLTVTESGAMETLDLRKPLPKRGAR